MKSLLPLLLAIALPCICHRASAAAEEEQGESTKWNIRVEVLMVAVPQDKCLPLLPDLRDPKKIDAAYDQLLGMIGKKEANLTGYPIVQTQNGARGVSESILEKRYPTEFSPPPDLTPAAAEADSAAKTAKADASATAPIPGPTPTAFETRNLGSTLEVEPTVLKNGALISLNVACQWVDLLGYEYFDAGNAPKGVKSQIGQPQFLTSKDTLATTVKSGERLLIGVHPLIKPAGYIELFILQAVATPAK